MWIKAGAAGATLLLTPLAAAAADMAPGAGPYYQGAPVYKAAPVKAPIGGKGLVPSAIAYYNWTGFYVGAMAGYGWGRSDWSPPGLDVSPRGWQAGGTLGYNYQIGPMVLGLETDLAWSNMSGSEPFFGVGLETRNDWIGTTRARFGYAFDRFMPYVTGGLAYGNIKAEVPSLGLSDRDTKLGWALGGGLEYGFLGNWTAKAEYLYTDLGHMEPVFAAPGSRVDFSAHTVRLGVNYRFGGPVYSRF